jgi:ABC-2 type transport system permease protein
MSYQQHWLRSYVHLLHWQALRMKPIIPLALVGQLFTGVGAVIGLGFFLPQIDPQSALYLATGAPTLTLVTLGLVLVPQMVADAKSKGSFDYMWSLPIPRMAFLAADLTIWILVVLPGVFLALVVGATRYDFTLTISPLVVPAFMLVVLMATGVGYAIAHLSPQAELVPVITNFIVFCLFLFSPINFPIERLPNWLAAIHQVFPVKYAADAIRGTLTDLPNSGLEKAFLVLALWCLGSLGLTYMIFSRRR